MEHWEVIIVGAGPAGLTAGIYTARSGLKTLILEEKVPGGLVAEAPIIENYPGFPEGIRGPDLVDRMVRQAGAAGVEIRSWEGATRMELSGEEKVVETKKGAYSANAVILAMGASHKKLGVPGEEEFAGRGVSYCALCDGPLFKGKRVLVVGGGNSAVASAQYLAGIGVETKLAHRRSRLRAGERAERELVERGVEILWNTELREIRGESLVESVKLYNNSTGEEWEMNVDGVFIQVGEKPNSEVAADAGVEVDEDGYIKVDRRQRTNIRGVYACGDITNNPVKQIGTAVGQAIVAATEAYGYIRRPYYYRE